MIDNLNVDVAKIQQVPVGTPSISLPYLLTGSWTFSGPPTNPKIELDGTTSIAVPISVVTALATGLAGLADLTASLDLAASLNISFSYHLEESPCLLCPEPSSVVLLGWGLCAAIVPAVRRLRRLGR